MSLPMYNGELEAIVGHLLKLASYDTELRQMHGLSAGDYAKKLLDLSVAGKRHEMEKTAIVYNLPPNIVAKAWGCTEAQAEAWIGSSKYSRDRHTVLMAHMEGLTVLQIADRVGLDRQTIYSWLKDAGVEKFHATPQGATDEERALVIALYNEGLTWPEIQERTGMSNWRVNGVLSEARRQGLVQTRREDLVKS